MRSIVFRFGWMDDGSQKIKIKLRNRLIRLDFQLIQKKIKNKTELKIFSSFQKNHLKEVDFSPQTRRSSRLGPGVKGHPPGVTRVVSENTVPSSASPLGLIHSVPVKTEEDGGGGGVRLSVCPPTSVSLSLTSLLSKAGPKTRM